MEQAVESLNPRKRSAPDLPPSSDAASAKRPCSDTSPSASPHLTLLEELYDLEAEDEEVAIEAPLQSSTQEDLVAEMMKSLEKVIEESDDNRVGEEEASTSNPSSFTSPASSPALDFTWNNEVITDFASSPAAQNASFHGELEYEEDFKENAQIRQLLQASDDELGLPLSSSSSDLDESSFHEEWASLANENSGPVNFNWLDASSFHQFEEASVLTKEIFEPLLLF